MAFQVTQCPSCESTFNTNPQLLNMAAGKVRCGACLSVFLAAENFVESDLETADSSEQESVFVGHDPGDFFDPSSFLTRSSLLETADSAATDSQDNETTLPPAVSSTAIDALAEADSHEDAIPFANDTLPGLFTDNDAQSPEPNDEQAAQAVEQSTDSVAHDESQEHLEFFSAVDESIDELFSNEEIDELEEIAALSVPAQQIEEILPDEANQQLQQDHPHEEQPSDSLISEAVPDEPASFADFGESVESATTEINSPPTQISEPTTGTEPEPDRIRPENVTLAASFAIDMAAQKITPQDSLTPPTETIPGESIDENNDIQEVDLDHFDAGISDAAQDELEQQVVLAIEEQDFVATVESGFIERAAAEREPDDLDSHDTLIELGNIAAEPNLDSASTAQEQDESTATYPDAEDTAIEEAEQAFSASFEEAPDSHSALEGIREAAADEEPDTSTAAIRARALRTELRDDEALEKLPQEHLKSLNKMAIPVQLDSGLPNKWGRRIGLGFLILLLSAGVSAQYFWRHKDRYSINPQFRSAYLWVCNQIPCNLPDFSDIDAIRSDNLTVRSHPERTNGLMVTVEIRNTAQFPQKFPVLILSFNSANNDVIALREFAPEEYLDPGLRDIAFMPVFSPVQIGLPIIDPGSDAVNYTLAFRSP